MTLEGLCEAPVNLMRWASDRRVFTILEQRYTAGDGGVHDPDRWCGELEAVSLALPGWRAVARCFRALPGQPMRFHMRAWKLREATRAYTWKDDDNLEAMVHRCGYSATEFLSRLGLTDANQLAKGMELRLPCWEAAYWLEAGDTLEWLAGSFGYSGVEELLHVNGYASPSELDGSEPVLLPGWRFFYALPNEPLESLDERFVLPRGSCRTVGRVHHPEPRAALPWESVAVPSAGFMEGHGRREEEDTDAKKA